MGFSLRTDGFYWTFWTRRWKLSPEDKDCGLMCLEPNGKLFQDWGGVVSCAFKIDGLVRFNVVFFAVEYCRHLLGYRFGSLLQLLPKHLPLQPLIQGLRTLLILEPTYFFWLWPVFCSFPGLQTLSLVKIGKRCSTIPIMHTLWQSPMAMEHLPFDDFPLKPPFTLW